MLRNFFEFYLYPTQLPLTAISALWLRRSTAFRWLQQPIGRHLMIDVVEQVIERHQEVKNEGISEIADRFGSMKVILPGMLLYALGLFATAHSSSAAEFMLGNGVLIGIALSGTAFGAVYGALSRIFPAEHRSW